MLILDIMYPPHCAVCDRVIAPSGNHICDSCRLKLPYIEEPRCMKCGKEIEKDDIEYCKDCQDKKRSFRQGFPLFRYIPPVSDSVLEMKYKGRQEHALFYGEEMARVFGERYKKLGIQAIVPVPLHKKKLAHRGYNQAELLADVIGERIGLPVITDIIIRQENTKPQSELDNVEREVNIKNAFTVKSDNSYFKKYNRQPEIILLVDDIYTTGATIEACTEVCHQAGIEDVYCTSVCIGTGI